MSKLAEYAEKIVLDGFRRQLDQEENVIRSLPLVIAGAGLIGTILASYKLKLCKFDPHSILSIGLYACAWMMGLCVVLMLSGLFIAIRRRRYEYPMDELEFLDYVQEMQDYYAKLAASAATRPAEADGSAQDPWALGLDAEAAALADIREAITRQFAEAARINRRNNQAKEFGRSLAVNGLALLMMLVFAMISLIYLRHLVAPGVCHA